MTTARDPQVTDELLSAYLDDAVTDAERHLVETAIAEDAELAWRLESLRATVRLLRELPALALPRSFVLTPEQLGKHGAAPALSGPARPTASAAAPPPVSFWRRAAAAWRTFWQMGNPALRNAMAASFAALLVLLTVPRMLAPVAPAALPMTNNAAPVARPVAQTAVAAPTATRAVTVVEQELPAAPAAAADAAAAGATSGEAGETEEVEAFAVAAEEATETAPQEGAAQPAPPAPALAAGENANPAAKFATAATPEQLVAQADARQSLAAPAPAGAGVAAASGPRDVLAEAAAPEELPAGAEEGAVSALAAPALAAAPPLPEAAPAAPASQPAAEDAAAGSQQARATAAEPILTSTQAPTALPTVVTAAPATPAPVALAAEDRARIQVNTPPPRAAVALPATTSLLPFFQGLAALGAVAFGLLWWRSRRP